MPPKEPRRGRLHFGSYGKAGEVLEGISDLFRLPGALQFRLDGPLFLLVSGLSLVKPYEDAFRPFRSDEYSCRTFFARPSSDCEQQHHELLCRWVGFLHLTYRPYDGLSSFRAVFKPGQVTSPQRPILSDPRGSI